MPLPTGRLPGFFKLSVAERRAKIAELAALSPADVSALAACGELSEAAADAMIENVIGTYSLPIGVATNFIVDGEHYVVPMVLEEASVVAAASNMAKRCHKRGGFFAKVDDPVMIGQVELRSVAAPEEARARILAREAEVRARCDAVVPSMCRRGGGCRGVEVRLVEMPASTLLVVHLLVDVRDAMGANVVNTICEALAPFLLDLCGEGASMGLRILSNLATRRLARVEARFTPEELGDKDADGAAVIEAILAAYAFAAADPYRACTNNKGVMNAISSVAVACGQDSRAIEAGAHAYAATKRQVAAGGGSSCSSSCSSSYAPICDWARDEGTGDLVGTIEVPMAVGLVGGAVKVHPAARANVAVLGVESADDLAKVMAAAGLAQNLAALRALATDGIQKGHMKLHARSRDLQKP